MAKRPKGRRTAKPEEYAVPVATIAERMGMMRVAGGHLNLDRALVKTSEVNRPGLQLTGYTEHFGVGRLQIIGWTETAYLSSLPAHVREQRLDAYFALGFPALIVARGLHVMPDMVQAADRHDVPVFVTDQLTSPFAGALTWMLTHELAPRQQIAAGLVDVYGEGVLIIDEGGLGRSEVALELVRRGHRLIADDRVEVRRISADQLRGRPVGDDRHQIEIPGVGVVDVQELFGIGAIKPDARVTLVVVLELRDFDKEYERVGIDDHVEEVFEVPVPRVTIPVQPGRNLAVIVEAAALNHRQRALGYIAAAALTGSGMPAMGDSVWFEAFGWLGSGLIIASLMQSRVLRFRVLNLLGAIISMTYNAVIGVWPFAAMNAVITVIDVYWLNRLLRDRHSAHTYEALEVGVGDAYLGHVLRTHAAEIVHRHPGIGMEVLSQAPDGAGGGSGGQDAEGEQARRWAFLVLKEAETVGVVLVRDEGEGVGVVELDFVTTRYRDFTPGEFVYKQSGVFAQRGFRRLVVDDAVAEGDYYARVGFEHVEGRWERVLEPAG